MPASDDATPALPGLSPICGQPIEAHFDGGLMSSDGGLLVLRQIERRLGIVERLASRRSDPRAPERIAHTLDEIIRFRMLMIAAGYEDGNDANSLRSDPLFKLAMDRLAMLPVGPLRHALSYLVAGSLLEGRKASYQIMTFPKPLFFSGWS